MFKGLFSTDNQLSLSGFGWKNLFFTYAIPKRPMATVKKVKKAIFRIREIRAEEVRPLAPPLAGGATLTGVRAGEPVDWNTAPGFSDSTPDELRVVFAKGLPAIGTTVTGIGITGALVDKEDTGAIIAGAGSGED